MIKNNICMLYTGNFRSFSEITEEHKIMINDIKQYGNLDIFCVVSDKNLLNSELGMLKIILSPKKILHEKNENHNFLEELKNHDAYIENKNYIDKLENNVTGKMEISEINENFISQFMQLKKGVEMIEKYEIENEIKYDIFIKSRYDFVLKEKYDFSILNNTNINFYDLLSCGCENYKSLLSVAKEHYKINSDYEYLSYLKNLKIDHYASRIYTKHAKNLNLGGRYIKNYDAIEKIYIMNKSGENIDNIVYFLNDWFFFTLRKNMKKLGNFIFSYGQNRIDNCNHIFAPEYQLFAYCKQNDLLPIVHLNSHIGGIFKKEIHILNDVYVPNNKKFIMNGIKGYKRDNYYIFKNNKVIIPLIVYYSYYGEKIEIKFNIITKNKIKVNVEIDYFNRKSTETFDSESGTFLYKFICNYYGRLIINLIFIQDNNDELQISSPKINHDEIYVDYMSFYTKGLPYDSAYNMHESYKITTQLTEKYTDSYVPIFLDDLDNNEEREYITSNSITNEKFSFSNINVEKIGYFKWKPYIILKNLKNLKEGHILVYRDGNFAKYPQYLNNFERIKIEVARIMNNIKESIFFAYENIGTKGIFHQKKYVSDVIGNDKNEFFLNHDLINASLIICKKSDLSIKILEEWLKYCKNDNLVDYSNIDVNTERQDFRWHCNDQAVLNSIIIKMKQEKILDINYPYYFTDNRILNFDLYKDIRTSKFYDGFILNKIPLITNNIQTSHGGTLYRLNIDTLHFTRSNSNKIVPFQWLGYDISRKNDISLRFEIKFYKFIPKFHNCIGIKVHHPEFFYNNWIKECVVNEWKLVQYVIPKSYDISDLLLLIFDHGEPCIEFDIKNFVVW
jgi:hypothetical protein